MRVSRILHAGYLFESQSTQILFDPIFESPFSRNCYAFPDVKFDFAKIQNLEISAIFVSHIHDDHFSLESLRWLNRKTPVYIYSHRDEALKVIRDLGFKEVLRIHLDQTIQVGPIQVTSRYALNSEMDCLFEIRTEGLKALNVVDSWIDPLTFKNLAKQSPWDLVLWPFQILREVEVLSPKLCSLAPEPWPHEWIEQLKELSPRFLVPSSCQFRQEEWSWYNCPVRARSSQEAG